MSVSIFNLKDRPSIKVQCNWDANIPEKSIEDTVSINFHKDGDPEEQHNQEDLNDILDVKTTVNFIKPEKMNEKPYIKFRVPDAEDVYVSGITVLCDSRTIEIFGDHGIYIDTVQGQVIEETEEFYVYEFLVNFGIKKINKEVTIKLVNMSHQNHFWVYGILLKLKKISAENKTSSSICYDNVQDLMKDCRISESANKAFNFMKETNRSFSMLKGDGPSPEKKGEETEPLLADLKSHIDHKFQILTEFLIMREKHFNDKLDKVIDMLKTKE